MTKKFALILAVFFFNCFSQAASNNCPLGYTLTQSGNCVQGEYLVCQNSLYPLNKLQIELLPNQSMTFLDIYQKSNNFKKISTTLEYPTLLDLDSRDAQELFREFHFDKDTLMEFKVYRALSKDQQLEFTYFNLNATSFHGSFKAIRHENTHALYSCRVLPQ